MAVIGIHQIHVGAPRPLNIRLANVDKIHSVQIDACRCIVRVPRSARGYVVIVVALRPVQYNQVKAIRARIRRQVDARRCVVPVRGTLRIGVNRQSADRSCRVSANAKAPTRSCLVPLEAILYHVNQDAFPVYNLRVVEDDPIIRCVQRWDTVNDNVVELQFAAPHCRRGTALNGRSGKIRQSHICKTVASTTIGGAVEHISRPSLEIDPTTAVGN